MLNRFDAQLDRMVERTPDDRDRTIDLVRALSIVVVVLWHWTLSVTHRDGDGALTMPNPIPEVPLAWAATWVLQVMPLFFVVGGFSNLRAWCSDRDDGGWRAFHQRRVLRLAVPVGAFVAVWVVVDLLAVVGFGTRSVLEYGLVVFVPLWFIGAYLGVVLLVPITATAHLRWGARALAVLAVAVALVDVGRFVGGIEALGWVNTVLVWVLVHQLGYFAGSARLRRWRWWRRLMVALVGFGGLALVTTFEGLPRSMVAHGDAVISPLLPTTSMVALAALGQFGLVLVARPHLARWLSRTGPWKAVVALNAVIMTVFLWHMAALLVVILGYEALGHDLLTEPTSTWWAQRPVWLVAPLGVLAVLVAVFAGIEQTGRRVGSDRPGPREQADSVSR